MFVGLDPDGLRGSADHLVHQAAALDHVASHVDALIRAAMHHWSGPEAQDFHQWWVGQHRPRLVAVAQTVSSMAGQLRRQAADQERASGTAAAHASAVMAPPGAPSTMLALAKNAEDPKAQLPPGWSAVDEAGLLELGIDPKALHDASTGFDATIYTDGHGDYVLSFAGSAGDLGRPWDATSVDWRENYKSAASVLFANQSAQTQQSVNLAMQLKSAVGTGHVELTGHSLGGRDAAAASVATGAPAMTFNAAGVTDEDLLYANEVAGRHIDLGGYVLGKLSGGETLRNSSPHSQITNYVITGGPGSNDLLTTVQESTPARDALGAKVAVPSDAANPIDAHDLRNFEGKI